MTPTQWDALPLEDRETMTAHYQATTRPDTAPRAFRDRHTFGEAVGRRPPQRVKAVKRG